MITVWGRATSSNVQPVMWTIAELGLEARRIDRGHTHGGLDTPEFLAMNPHGRIPVIRDGDGPPLWESYAIIRYLAARYGEGTLWEPDPLKRAQIEMWADWLKIEVTTTFTLGVFWQVVRTTAAKRDKVGIAAAVAKLRTAFGRVERQLEQRDWLSGERFGIADIMLGHLLYRWYEVEIDRPDLPRLAAYYARLAERPAYREHVMVPFDMLRVP